MRITRHVFTLGLISSVFGCTSVATRTVHVKSAPAGARIEVNDVNQGVTPLALNFECRRYWVGYLVSSNGWAMSENPARRIAAYPTDATSGGTSQTKVIEPCLIPDGSEVFFDIKLDSVTPVQRMEIKSK